MKYFRNTRYTEAEIAEWFSGFIEAMRVIMILILMMSTLMRGMLIMNRMLMIMTRTILVPFPYCASGNSQPSFHKWNKSMES